MARQTRNYQPGGGIAPKSLTPTQQQTLQNAENAASSFTATFTDTEWQAGGGKIPITHNLNSSNIGFTLWDGGGEWVGAIDNVKPLDANRLEFDLTSFGNLVGTYRVVIFSAVATNP